MSQSETSERRDWNVKLVVRVAAVRAESMGDAIARASAMLPIDFEVLRAEVEPADD